MLDASTLAHIRAAQVDALDGTCTIQTLTEGTDGAGGQTVTWASTYTGIACRLMYVSPPKDYRIQADQPAPSRVPVLTVPHDQTLSPGMRVLYDGTYSVLGVNEGQTWQTAKRAYLERVEI